MKKRIFSELTKSEEQKALAIHEEAIVVDGLGCPSPTSENFDKMIQGGVTAVNWTVGDVNENLRQSIGDIAKWYSLLRENKDKIMSVTNVGDITKAKQQKRLGIIFGLQDPEPIEDEITNLEVLHRVGMRVIQLTYNNRNRIGNGVTERSDAGLSHFGVRVIEEMNALGILIDLSHCGEKTAMETIEISKDPVSFTHIGAKALTQHVRTKTDEEIKAMAEKGGVLGVCAWGGTFWKKERVQPTIDDFLDQIDYMINLVGVDHVGIGLDIDEGKHTGEEVFSSFKRAMNTGSPGFFPPWWDWRMNHAKDLITYSETPNITKGLMVRGYSDQEMKKILGENFLSLFERVWK